MPTQAPTQPAITPRPPAHQGPAVLIVGNVVDGVRHVGPFPHSAAANEYADHAIRNEEWIVADLEPASAESLAEYAEEAPVAPVSGNVEPDGPISVLMLTDDWEDDPGLTDAQKDYLRAIPRQDLVDALDVEFQGYDDQWFHLLDIARANITASLLDAQ